MMIMVISEIFSALQSLDIVKSILNAMFTGMGAGLGSYFVNRTIIKNMEKINSKKKGRSSKK